MDTSYTDPRNMIITAGGVRIEGFADGDYVDYDPPEAFTVTVGTDGMAARMATNNTETELTISLMPGSPANDVLNAIFRNDVKNPNGQGVFVLTISDLFGRYRFTSPETWIKKSPQVTLGREAGQRDWVFTCIGAENEVLGS